MKRMNNKQLTNQRAMEYIIYMMVGSYFKSAKCTTKVIERRLFLQYKELSEKVQEDRETKCIRFTEGFLMKNLPERIWGEDVQVGMAPNAKNGLMIISFKGQGWTLNLSYDVLSDARFEYDFKDKTVSDTQSEDAQESATTSEDAQDLNPKSESAQDLAVQSDKTQNQDSEHAA